MPVTSRRCRRNGPDGRHWRPHLGLNHPTCVHLIPGPGDSGLVKGGGTGLFSSASIRAFVAGFGRQRRPGSGQKRVGELASGVQAGRSGTADKKWVVDAYPQSDVLEERKVGREKIFVHPKFMRLLTADSNEFEPYGR